MTYGQTFNLTREPRLENFDEVYVQDLPGEFAKSYESTFFSRNGLTMESRTFTD